VTNVVNLVLAEQHVLVAEGLVMVPVGGGPA